MTDTHIMFSVVKILTVACLHFIVGVASKMPVRACRAFLPEQ